MKHFKLFTAILAALMITSAVMFNACSKQDNDLQSIDTGEVQMTAADLKFQKQLVEFRDKIKYIQEHPGYKSGEVMSVDSAIYLMEAMFNYTYGFPEKSYQEVKHDTCNLVFETDFEGMVSLDDVNLKFLEITGTIQSVHYNSGFENQGLILASIEKREVDGNQTELEIYVVTGNLNGTTYPFAEGDDWWYGLDAGMCDGSNDTTDAAEMIERNIVVNYILPSPPPGYRYVYAPEETITLEGNEYQNPNMLDPTDNYLDYLMYYAEAEVTPFVDSVKCLAHQEMNFYVEGGIEIATNKLPDTYNKPSNWLFMSCDYNDKTEGSDEDEVLRHKANFVFSLRYLIPEEEDPRIIL
jgi:hypothetical protein